MYQLLDALEIPGYYICFERINSPGIEAVMILLRRFAYPNRWCDLKPLYGSSESELTLILNKVILSTFCLFKIFLRTSL